MAPAAAVAPAAIPGEGSGKQTSSSPAAPSGTSLPPVPTVPTSSGFERLVWVENRALLHAAHIPQLLYTPFILMLTCIATSEPHQQHRDMNRQRSAPSQRVPAADAAAVHAAAVL